MALLSIVGQLMLLDVLMSIAALANANHHGATTVIEYSQHDMLLLVFQQLPECHAKRRLS